MHRTFDLLSETDKTVQHKRGGVVYVGIRFKDTKTQLGINQTKRIVSFKKMIGQWNVQRWRWGKLIRMTGQNVLFFPNGPCISFTLSLDGISKRVYLGCSFRKWFSNFYSYCLQLTQQMAGMNLGATTMVPPNPYQQPAIPPSLWQ